MRFNTIPSAVVSASVNTVGGVPLCRDDDAAKADVVADKLRQPLSPAETDLYFYSMFESAIYQEKKHEHTHTTKWRLRV